MMHDTVQKTRPDPICYPCKNMYKISTAYILGAGFSNNAGIPIQRDFLQKLLYRKGADKVLAEILKKYVNSTYGAKPTLEDVFTFIDMSANTGHHLGGKDYFPSRLRSLRRILITRILQVLKTSYKQKKVLKDFIGSIDMESSAFISLNWDTVLEKEMKRVYGNKYYSNYGIGEKLLSWWATDSVKVPVAKVHGSANWLYCDNCRQIYATRPDEEGEIPYFILKSKDLNNIESLKLIDDDKKKDLAEYKVTHNIRRKNKFKCLQCSTELSTRLATFSYRKVLETPMLQKSWYWAEELLSRANKWVFIGYSLPASDFEFKYLLKRLELASKTGKQIIVVTTKDKEGNHSGPYYQQLFKKIPSCNIFDNGLKGYVKTIKGS